MARRRWPAWVYGSGEEPDYRFSFANERTFLAWIRTALALIAGGVALDAFDLGMRGGVDHVVAAVTVLLGLGAAVAAWWRWAVAERAIRHRRPLPAQTYSVALTAVVVVVAVVLLIGMT
ncbi:YidH family protein [Nocardioides sp. GCM10027113]|uniref:YidH family protein n=1 Tax=unclassified Nocardioides TaxID=2615069 RepID=UPI003616EBCD